MNNPGVLFIGEYLLTVTTGQIFKNVFIDHQTGDSIERIVTFLDKNVKDLQTVLAVTIFEILDNRSESFFQPKLQKKVQNTEAVARRCSVK